MDWDITFRETDERLCSCDSVQQVEFYISDRTSNEAALPYQPFVREYGGSSPPGCSNMCYRPTSAGLTPAIGLRKGTVELDDFDHCDPIICIGHNPDTNHPRMLITLRDIVKHGAEVISISPLNERGLERFSPPQGAKETFIGQVTELSSDYHQVKMGGDASLLKGIMETLTEIDRARILLGQQPMPDHAPIDQRTAGHVVLYDDLRQRNRVELGPDLGLTRSQMEDLVYSYNKSSVTIACYDLGVAQHKNSIESAQQLVNLLLLEGNMGKPGVGVCPLCSYSSVQSNRSMGINEMVSGDFLQRLERHLSIRVSCKYRRSSVESIRAIEQGDAEMSIRTGGNLMVAMSQPQRTSTAMKNLDLQVHVVTRLNRSHLLLAKYNHLPPALGRTECDMQMMGIRSVTVEDSVSMVHVSRGALKPTSRWLESEPVIMVDMACVTPPRSPINWGAFTGDCTSIRDAIEAMIPMFHDYNVRTAEPGGFRMDMLVSRRERRTEDGKASFIVSRQWVVKWEHQSADALILAAPHSHDQYSTMIYSMNDRHHGITDHRDMALLNAKEVTSRGLSQGDVVNIQAPGDSGQPCTNRIIYGLTVVIYNMVAGPIGAYLPEVNVLFSLDAIDIQSSTPAYESVPVTLIKAQFLL